MSVDDEVTGELVRAALPRLLRVARLLTGDDAMADDLVADAIARALPRLRTGAVQDAPAYLRRAVVNLANRRWRRARMSATRDRAASTWAQPDAEVATATVERDAVLRALAQLPVRRRTVVVLRFYEDLTEPAIAALMGTSVGTVKSQLSRAIEQLRGELKGQD